MAAGQEGRRTSKLHPATPTDLSFHRRNNLQHLPRHLPVESEFFPRRFAPGWPRRATRSFPRPAPSPVDAPPSRLATPHTRQAASPTA
ncbi:hypothetical protein IMZ48_42135 [Candidatus Bathyarchaeota archaeon]|nr:hypothetical protein [Candidatus Bathyarchaeota archaeon]